jgi:hypothetical protein
VSPHRIRLPPPWQTSRQQWPDTCAVTYQRTFQCPTGLSNASRIAIELELLEPLAFAVRLNGEPCSVQHCEALLFEVAIEADRFRSSNQLEVEIRLQSAVDLERLPETTVPLTIGQHYLKSAALRIE